MVFCASAAALLAFIYGATVRAIDIEIDTALDTELATLAEVNDRLGFAALVNVVKERSAGLRASSDAYLLVDSQLKPIAGNLAAWPAPTVRTGKSFSFDVDEQYGAVVVPRLFRARSVSLPGNYHLLVAHGVERRVRIQKTISDALVWGLVAALALGVLGGLISGRRVLRRTGEIVDTAARIMAGDLVERIPVRGGNDEIDRLARQLNLMLERIEQLVEGMRTVSDTIAHELRTPLTRLHAVIESALTAPPDPQGYRRALEDALEETASLLKVFNALMSIAQARSNTLRDQMEHLDLGEILSDTLELYEPAISERAIKLQYTPATSKLTVFGHRQLLAQSFANLLDNAVKFTPVGGCIQIGITRSRGCAMFFLRDNGPGIPQELRNRLLKPYARGEPNGIVPGLGLGLSLVAAVAELHSSTLEFGDDGPGLSVVLRFPIAERCVATKQPRSARP